MSCRRCYLRDRHASWRFVVIARTRDRGELWGAYLDSVLPGWMATYPGTRPANWWLFEAPEPCRRRLGGSGTPCHEVLAYAPEFDLGLPAYWVSDWERRYYTRQAKDINGNPIG